MDYLQRNSPSHLTVYPDFRTFLKTMLGIYDGILRNSEIKGDFSIDIKRTVMSLFDPVSTCLLNRQMLHVVLWFKFLSTTPPSRLLPDSTVLNQCRETDYHHFHWCSGAQWEDGLRVEDKSLLVLRDFGIGSESPLFFPRWDRDSIPGNQYRTVTGCYG